MILKVNPLREKVAFYHFQENFTRKIQKRLNLDMDILLS